MHPAYSVIFFTAASGAGYGLVALTAAYGALGGVPVDPAFGAAALGLGAALITGGLLSSTFHLGRPERAWRAFSQWRTSWLSREGVLAAATYLPLGLAAWGWFVEGTLSGPFGLFAAILVAFCVLTVHATGMIYATLRTVHAWHNRMTVPGYLTFALLTGALWFHALAALFGVRSPEIALAAVAALFLAWYVKRAYWRSIDATRGPATPESSTGLAGPVRLLDPPNTGENFVQREMGYRIARKHALKLRRIGFCAFFLVPLVLTGLTAEASDWIAVPGTLLAAASASAGTLIERWLFFAEARHAAMLYYGASSS